MRRWKFFATDSVVNYNRVPRLPTAPAPPTVKRKRHKPVLERREPISTTHMDQRSVRRVASESIRLMGFRGNG